MKNVRTFNNFVNEKSFTGRAWQGKIGNIDDLLSWMYSKDILGPYDKNEKDRLFTAYYRFYNDGEEPDIERMAGETYADALEREIEEFIKEILSSYAGKYDRRTFRFDKLLGELRSLQNQLHFKDRTGNNDKEWEKKMSYDINGFIYFYKKLGKLGNPQFDNLVANIDKTFKAWEKEADKEIQKTLKKNPKLGDWDKGLSTNLIFGAKYAKMQEFGVVTPKIEKLYNTVKEIGDELHSMIGDIIEATERAKDTLQENVEVREGHVLEFQEYLNEKQEVEKVEEGQYSDNMNGDQLKAYNDAMLKIKIPDGDPAKGDIVDYPDMMDFLEKHKSYKKLSIGKKKYVQKAVGWAIRYRWMQER